MKYFLLALLWGLSLMGGAMAQQMPAFTQFGACVTTLDPTFATGGFGRVRCDANGNMLISSSPSSPTFTSQAGVTRSRLTCTLPAYAAGGNVVCTNEAGQQTTTACAANTACQIVGANANRKTAEFTNRTAGATVDVGYSASVAPGNAKGYDGPSATNGQGGSGTEIPAHVGSYYAATTTAGAVLVFVQGQ